MNDERVITADQLQEAINRGMALRGLVDTQGFKVLASYIDTKIKDTRNEWMRADTIEKVNELRLKALALQELVNWINAGIVAGQRAEEALKEQTQSE